MDSDETDFLGLILYFFSCSSASDTLACLRAVGADQLQQINQAVASAAYYGSFIFVPVVDGSFIVERPTLTLSKGRLNGVSILFLCVFFQIF